MKIGLLGCLINNENLGCQALTYSILSLLEDIRKEAASNADFYYYVFEANPDGEKTKQAAVLLDIEPDRMKSYDVTPMFRLRRFIHHFGVGMKTLSAMRECDVFIDMTGGDSFTDIYGQYTFDSETNVKLLVKRLGKKLILGPQTYGPFNSEKNLQKAVRLINKADLVISRDQQSKDYLSSYIKNECHVTTDVAFRLPYTKIEKVDSGRIKVGINVSGLLLKDKTESTQLATELKADYDKYICELIKNLLDSGKYEIHIIPHVGNDGAEWVRNQFDDKLIYHNQFQNPMDAKSVIAEMDIFVGSRMHATIGAFSSGVATIPVAYSRKFSGLFEHLEYPYVVDLCGQTTEDCLKVTIGEIKKADYLRHEVLEKEPVWRKETSITKDLIKKLIL